MHTQNGLSGEADAMTKPGTSLMRSSAPKTSILLLGGVIGAITGIGAAYLLWQAKEKRFEEFEEDVPLVSSGGLMRIGLVVVGLLRQIGDIARGG